MTPEHMFRLARDIDQALASASVLGAVVLHGTDVLVESAYMADLTLRSHKPVVFTGSMRYYSETGFDGIRNLLNGVKACLLPLPEDTGVGLLMTIGVAVIGHGAGDSTMQLQRGGNKPAFIIPFGLTAEQAIEHAVDFKPLPL